MSFLGQIGAEAEKLRRLVADLLDLSRLESKAATGVVSDVREAIGLAVTGHRAAADKKGLELRMEDDDVAGQDVFAAADTTDLAIALDNLLANAVAYTERGGVTVRATADPDTVNIAVIDTGIGIPAADLARVFERFYRVDRARSRDSGGTGLGLSLVRHVVERSGGIVDIASTPDVGTTVTVRLPRAV
jgi:two-component system phosphate regulon sensor histidine kinase PhoR